MKADWGKAGIPFFLEKGSDFDFLPNCCNCENQVPKNFLSLSETEESRWGYPCCSKKCVNELFKKINGFYPDWMDPKKYKIQNGAKD